MHESFRDAEGSRLLGRSVDLEKAFKQLGRRQAHASFAIFCVWNPRLRRAEFFEALARPFGVRASVHSFNRLARALAVILAALFKIPVTHYFDDFPIVVPSADAESAEDITLKIFELLGWKIKMSGDKALPFSDVFDSLGVSFDLRGSNAGKAQITNKKERVEMLVQDIEATLKSGRLTPAQAASYRGRLIFAQGQTFGRCGLTSLRVLGDWAAPSRTGQRPAWWRVERALRFWKEYFRIAAPRTLDSRLDRPALVFTDGACEGQNFEQVTVGGVLVEEHGYKREYFGFKVPPALVAAWQQNGTRQTIGQAELLPVLVAKLVWSRRLQGRRTLHFIDNESARLALIKGASPSAASASIIDAFWHNEARIAAASWFERVPSASNISDSASRLDFAAPELAGAVPIEAMWAAEGVAGALW